MTDIRSTRQAGSDPREQLQVFSFAPDQPRSPTCAEGMTLPGIVTNITAFGAFVFDTLGIKQDGWCISRSWPTATLHRRPMSSIWDSTSRSALLRDTVRNPHGTVDAQEGRWVIQCRKFPPRLNLLQPVQQTLQTDEIRFAISVAYQWTCKSGTAGTMLPDTTG